MGWGGGTEIFDTVAESCNKNGVSWYATVHILKDLLVVLEDKDWDVQDECCNPIAKEVIKSQHPEWYENE